MSDAQLPSKLLPINRRKIYLRTKLVCVPPLFTSEGNFNLEDFACANGQQYPNAAQSKRQDGC